jgi:hypothetical protein
MRHAPDVEFGEPLTNHSLILTVALKRALRERALAEGRNQSEIVRQILAAYLRR